MTDDFTASPEHRILQPERIRLAADPEPVERDDTPVDDGPPLAVGLLGYLLLLVVLLGGLGLAVMALMRPMVLPAIRLLLQHH